MRKVTGLFILTAIATSCSSSTGGSPSGVVRSLETTVVSPVRNSATWPGTFNPDPSASITDGALTVTGYLPFDQCRFTTESDHRVLDGSVFVTLASKAFPREPA